MKLIPLELILEPRLESALMSTFYGHPFLSTQTNRSHQIKFCFSCFNKTVEINIEAFRYRKNTSYIRTNSGVRTKAFFDTKKAILKVCSFFFTFSFIKALTTNSSKFRNHETKMTRGKKSSNVEELPALSVSCRKFSGLFAVLLVMLEKNFPYLGTIFCCYYILIFPAYNNAFSRPSWPLKSVTNIAIKFSII